MSEPEAEDRSLGSIQRTYYPAVCLAVDEATNPYAVVGTIPRASEHGHDLLVECRRDQSHRAITFAERLGAHVESVPAETRLDQPAEPTIEHAKARAILASSGLGCYSRVPTPARRVHSQ
jgi:hypothetical protein